jgi:hypothetical protein
VPGQALAPPPFAAHGLSPAVVLALQRTAGNQAVNRLMRKVGFEFQSEWPMRRANGQEREMLEYGKRTFKDAVGPDNASLRVDKNPYHFRIEADEGAEVGPEDDRKTMSVAEFVTDAFDEREELVNAMDRIAGFTEIIRGLVDSRPGEVTLEEVADAYGQWVGADEVRTAQAPDIVFGATPDEWQDWFPKAKKGWAADTTATPQATFGARGGDTPDGRARMKDLYAMLAQFDFMRPAVDDPEGERAESNELIAPALERARQAIAQLAPTEKDRWIGLQGFLALVVMCLWHPARYFKGTEKDDYAKASFALMARTDFHAMFARGLEGYEQAQFKKTAWVLSIAGMSGDGLIFPSGFRVQGSDDVHGGPTRREWLESIAEPPKELDEGDRAVIEQQKESFSDPQLTKLEKDMKKKDLMSRGHVKESAFSMGALPPSAVDREGAILEWRAMIPKGLEMKDWKAAALDVFDRVDPSSRKAPPRDSPARPGGRTRVNAPHVAGRLWDIHGTRCKRVRSFDDLRFLSAVYVFWDGERVSYWRLADVISKDANDLEAREFVFEDVRAEDRGEVDPIYDGLAVFTGADTVQSLEQFASRMEPDKFMQLLYALDGARSFYGSSTFVPLGGIWRRLVHDGMEGFTLADAPDHHADRYRERLNASELAGRLWDIHGTCCDRVSSFNHLRVARAVYVLWDGARVSYWRLVDVISKDAEAQELVFEEVRAEDRDDVDPIYDGLAVFTGADTGTEPRAVRHAHDTGQVQVAAQRARGGPRLLQQQHRRVPAGSLDDSGAP